MRILLIGGTGQLGAELADLARTGGHEVHAPGHDECDIVDRAGIHDVLDEAAPDVVINCAAWTRVDDAEKESDAAFRVNALGPRILAAACSARDILIVQLSTDYVFSGDAHSPIDEWQTPLPRSTYGASKLAGEREVRMLARRHQVVRTSWLYGRRGPNFVLTMLRAAQQGRPLRVVSDQLGSPTWTGHLAPALLRLASLGLPGTYHLTNAGVASWHGFAEAVFATVPAPPPVAAIASTEYPTPAPRPAYSVLDNRAWRLLGEEPLPPWQEGVRAYMRELRDRAVPGA